MLLSHLKVKCITVCTTHITGLPPFFIGWTNQRLSQCVFVGLINVYTSKSSREWAHSKLYLHIGKHILTPKSITHITFKKMFEMGFVFV